MLNKQYFWGNQLEKYEHIKHISNKNLIYLSYLSLFIPDLIYSIRYILKKEETQNINYIPTLSYVTIQPIPRMIHVILWYYGYFYRMKILTNGNGYYSYFYYGQLITWIFINLFPISYQGNTAFDNIHYVSACVNFNLFAIMKILYCKDPESFTLLFLNLMNGFIKKKYNQIGIFERLCMYHVIMTSPRIN